MERLVVITGASSGIGEATAARFRSGNDVVVNIDLHPPEGPAVGNRFDWRQADVGNWSEIHDLIKSLVEEYDRPVDVAIANAGISRRTRFETITEEQILNTLRVNTIGVINLWHSCLPYMLSGESSAVLLATASTNGNVGYPFYADYNASKAAVIELTKTLALEYAGQIRTACVSPGYVLTDMQRAEYTDEMIDETNRKIPIGRHAEPWEIAELYWFLASDNARYITGQQIVIDGGELAGGTASSFGIGARL